MSNIIMHNHSDFIQAVLAEFPELREEISERDGLPHVEMGAFARFTQEAKGAKAWGAYERAVRLVANLLPSADNELLNEIYVSYLENLDFEGPHGLTAWQLLPIHLQRAWHEIIEYDEKLFGRPWLQTKPKLSE